MRKEKSKLNIEIEKEILKKVRLETSTGSMKSAYEEDICKIRLELEIKTSEVAFNGFFKEPLL